ncbi:MAG: hypothetical protein ACFKPT_04570 [Gloeotrichia echinulata GP01]
MDVELQILKYLPRDAHPTVAIIDEYCAEYKDLFNPHSALTTVTP